MIASLHASSDPPWPLRRGVVHVWRFPCNQDPTDLDAVLAPDERARAERFVARVHRDAYVVQHATVRHLLARYTGTPPAELVFAYGPHGKPRLAEPAGLEWNLSHCRDVALLAITRDVALGVDIERLDAPLEVPELGRIVLAPDERALGAERHGFLRVWCRKEAALKATGIGLVDDLTAISVAPDRVDVAGETVYLQDLAAGTDHAAALATAAPCPPVGARELETWRAERGAQRRPSAGGL